MDKLNQSQTIFFEEIKKIQDEVVNVKLCTSSACMENILNEVTYETIYKIMELFDGYRTDVLDLEIIEKKNGENISSNIELHDTCANYLKSV